jgi:cyclin T
MYRKDPDAARRIYQKELLEKRKALILVGETLLLSTIRFDFNIQHPYEPLKLALKNLGISQKEVKQVAVNLVNDTLRTTLVVQFKPHYIAAGSLVLAAKFHNIRLPSEKGKVWWHQFDVAPKQLEAVIQQMTELFMRRNQCPMDTSIRSTPAPTPVEKQQTLGFPDPVVKYTYSSRRGPSRPSPAPTPIPTLVEKQQIIITPDPVLRHTHSSRGGLSRATPVPTPTPTLVKKQQIISTLDPVLRHTHASRTSLIGNNFDREASRCMPVDSLAHHNSTVSSARNGDHSSLRTQMVHSLNSTGMDGRSEKQSSRAALKADRSLNSTGMDGRWSEKLSSQEALKADHNLNSTGMDRRWSDKQSSQEALKADHVYHVCSGPKDINVSRVTNFIREKRRIREAGEHPAPVDKSDRDAWMGRQFRSLIVVETKSSSWKKQKV